MKSHYRAEFRARFRIERPYVSSTLARIIAFYLPQFHPIPENDEWWGRGFTEWTNVGKAKPLFPSHRQPRLPTELGYYDLRVPEVREAQAELARSAGVESFCYWHYWFGNGRRIIDRPFAEVLASGKPDFPFCLAWANQSWTGIWHGKPGTTLIEQLYPGREDEEAHFRWARTAFEDHRYSTVDGKPIFVIFAPHDMPSTTSFIEHWRELAHKAGLPGIYFVAISNRYIKGLDRYYDPILDAFDAVTLLVPQDYISKRGREVQGTLARRLKELNVGKLNPYKPEKWKRPMRIDYAEVVAHALEDMPAGERYLPSVLPGWDNTPRSRFGGVVYEGETPELFERYMRKALNKVKDHDEQHRIIFLKAWNEWAEGNYVEPDAIHGRAMLDVIRSVVSPQNGSSGL